MFMKIKSGLWASLLSAFVLMAIFSQMAITRAEPQGNPLLFPPTDNVLAQFEFNGDVQDVSGNDHHATLIGGDFVATSFGQGLRVGISQTTGLDWSAHAGLLEHPFTVEMVLVPETTQDWQKLFSFSDSADAGWYYKNQGIQAYPFGILGSGQVKGNERHYLAFVSTAPDQMDVYFQGILLGSTNMSFTAPPTEAIFFKDDTAVAGEILQAVVEGLRISSVARTPEEIGFMQNRLQGSGAISGRVTNESGEPLAGIEVTAYQSYLGDQWVVDGRSSTNSDGTYTISGLHPGAHRVYFADLTQTYRPEYYDDALTFATGTDVSVANETLTPNIDAVLQLPADPLITIDGPTIGVDPITGEVTIGVANGFQEEVTFVYDVMCKAGSPTDVMLHIGSATFSMSNTSDNLYSVTITTPDDLPTEGAPFTVTVSYMCDGAPVTTSDLGTVTLYDPSGNITDALTGELVKGATVHLYRIPTARPDQNGESYQCRTIDTRPMVTDGPFGAWSGVPSARISDGAWVNPDLGDINGNQIISPTVNPQVTGTNGRYAWDVAEGCWFVVVMAEGYATAVSPAVGVPPAVTDLDITLYPENQIYLPIIQR